MAAREGREEIIHVDLMSCAGGKGRCAYLTYSAFVLK